MIEQTKQDIIEEIKLLINTDGTKTTINPKYLEYFELEELQDIKEELENKKRDKKDFTKNYVDELYEKLVD